MLRPLPVFAALAGGCIVCLAAPVAAQVYYSPYPTRPLPGVYQRQAPGAYYAYPDDDEWSEGDVDTLPRQRPPAVSQPRRPAPTTRRSLDQDDDWSNPAPGAPMDIAPAARSRAAVRPQRGGVPVASLPSDADPAWSTPIDYDGEVNMAQHTRRVVADPTGEAAGTLTINTRLRKLYLSLGDGRALEYGVGVGREGFLWKGTAQVGRKAFWPGWTPPPEMLQRRPDLPRHMDGGMENPLGARALYLFKGNKDTYFRIHGTNEPDTIGHAVSSGCIRMMNADVIDLYQRVPKGAKVVVI